MTVKDLRTLVDNLDEYIHVPGGIQRLKKTILHLAVSGQLVPHNPLDGTSEELYEQIQAEKQKLIADGKLKKQKPLPDISEEKALFEIPKSWRWVRLGEVIDLKYGKGIDRKHRDKTFKYSFYGANGELDKVDKYLIEKNGIVVGRKGSAGAVNLVDGPFWPSDVTYYIEEGQFGAFDRKYLYYLLISLNLESLANGIKPGLNRNDAYLFCIVLFPYKTQCRIARKIENLFSIVDELANKYQAEQKERQKLVSTSLSQLAKNNNPLVITQLTEIIKTKQDTLELRKTILNLAVSGRLVHQDLNEGTGGELYKQIQLEKQKLIFEGKFKKQKSLPEISDDETIFDIPKSWRWVRLGDIVEMQNGFAFKTTQWKKSGLPIVRIQNLNSLTSGFNYVLEDEVDKKYIIDDGQVLLSWSGTPGTSFGVFNWDRGRAALNQHIFKCTVFQMNREFFKHASNSAIYTKLDTAHGGVGLKHLTKGQINNLVLGIPPLAEQHRIIQKTSKLLGQVSKLESLLEG